MLDSPGGSSHPNPAAASLPQGDPGALWDRESVALRLGAWLVAHACASVHVDALARQFPSSLAPRNRSRGSRSHSTVPNIETVPDIEHIIATVDASRGDTGPESDKASLSGTGSQSDAWSRLVTDRPGESIAGVAVLLPRAGDPRGLPSVDVIDHAVAAGSAVRIERTDGSATVLIPASRHEGLMTWRMVHDPAATSVDDPLSVADAHRWLRAAILEAEGALGDLGLRASPPTGRDLVEQAINDLSAQSFPRSFEPKRRELLVRAATIAWTCDLARADESVTITGSDIQARRQALTDLDRVARRALESAVAWSRSDRPR